MISALQAFPWPAGKAPWLVENCGTGVLERFGISGGLRQISMEKENFKSKGAFHALPAVENVPAPRNIQEHDTLCLCGRICDSSLQEAQQMLALAESLADSAVERFGQQWLRKALMLKEPRRQKFRCKKKIDLISYFLSSHHGFTE